MLELLRKRAMLTAMGLGVESTVNKRRALSKTVRQSANIGIEMCLYSYLERFHFYRLENQLEIIMHHTIQQIMQPVMRHRTSPPSLYFSHRMLLKGFDNV